LFPGKDPGTHGRRGWVGPRSGLDILEKRTIFCQVTDFHENLCARYAKPVHLDGQLLLMET